MSCQLKYTNSHKNFNMNYHYNTREPKPNKSPYIYIFKIIRVSYFYLYILYFNSIKIVTAKASAVKFLSYLPFCKVLYRHF